MLASRIRNTRYSRAVLDQVRQAGHVSNAEILRELRREHPALSATTVHRITSRLLSRGELAVAPATLGHAARFDANADGHDHFQCVHCDRLRDITVPRELFAAIQRQLGGCRIGGYLTVQGECNKCIKEEK